eukprot:5213919-Amphidinium_carterae.1
MDFWGIGAWKLGGGIKRCLQWLSSNLLAISTVFGVTSCSSAGPPYSCPSKLTSKVLYLRVEGTDHQGQQQGDLLLSL